MQSEATLSDQTAHPAMATSTSLSAATPRTCHLLPHDSASLNDVSAVSNGLDGTKLITCAADITHFSETMEWVLQPAATQSSQLNSMLLSKLPCELRDKIYRDAVVEDKDIPIAVTRYETEDGEQRRRLQIGHPLMRACKQTREEVSDMYYLENTFRVTDDLFEKQAIRELRRLLKPYAGKFTKLGVSHTFRGGFGVAKINFSISAFQGRIVVEPESSSVQTSTSVSNPGEDETPRMTTTSDRVCFCKIFQLALKHDGRDVVSWMRKYVDIVHRSKSTDRFKPLFGIVHSWTCAGRNVI